MTPESACRTPLIQQSSKSLTEKGCRVGGGGGEGGVGGLSSQIFT